VAAQADLSIDKTGPASAAPRQRFTYTLTIANAGAAAAQAVTVLDTLPEGVQYFAGTTRLNGSLVPDSSSGSTFPLDEGGLGIGTLSAGGTAVITFEVRAPNSARTIVNQASVSSSTPDPNTANNSDSLSTVVE
jgi:uncharacterized repeat protein (TIGR01451 family)